MTDERFPIGGELPVRRLGFGTGRLTGTGYWGPRGDAARAVAVLRRAVDRGVELIDTADNYGPDLAEQLVAQALHPYPAGLVIATKGGVVRTGPDIWHIAGRPEDLRARCEASLRRLRVETIDLYQLHRIDPAVPLADQLGALADLRQAGKIRHIGLDSVTAEQLEQAAGITEIASVQNRYHLLDRESEPVLERCAATGTAFLPWHPLGNGTLATGAGTAVGGLAERYGATPGQLALAWLLHRSPVLLPTPGTGSLAHLEQNLDAAAISLTDQDLDLLTGLSTAAQPR
ncbi:aldo/keto reductase [Streptomyces sp. NPDC092296]|uniref:aldo/keto reductase n=1 Tax=Streptomyces sp. NPDC092296 TaxID=3366012 RepID=UPI00382E5D42